MAVEEHKSLRKSGGEEKNLQFENRKLSTPRRLQQFSQSRQLHASLA